MSAMLHDIARSRRYGREVAYKEGYQKADVIVSHHDLDKDENDLETEKTLVFFSGHLVTGEREVTFKERYSQSAVKCVTTEARASNKGK